MALPNPYISELIATANAIVAPGKGILAADESTGTIGKRFQAISVDNTEENRRLYRQLLFSTPGLETNISGVIMYDETFYQSADDGTKFVDALKAKGIITGIKVDMGVADIMGTDGETVTQGETDLGKRCAKYYSLGARFAKWRGVLAIKPSGTPSELAVNLNVQALARYASICQANGLVPIVEPEVLMDGTNTIEVSAEVTTRVLAAQYAALAQHHVVLEGTLLKPNMVRAGEACPTPASAAQIARATVVALQRTLPVAVPGVTFLSGGMSEEDATVALNAINTDAGKKPWALTFSFGRALQQSVLQAWGGKAENVAAAQAQLLLRAKANGDASQGLYTGAAGGGLAASSSLHVKNYTY